MKKNNSSEDIKNRRKLRKEWMEEYEDQIYERQLQEQIHYNDDDKLMNYDNDYIY